MKVFICVLFVFLGLSLKAQGNLQFNQVLLLNATANNTTQWTVPAGKTWKIETMGSYSSAMYVYLNNTMAFEYVGPYINSLGAYYRGTNSPPLWLPAGTILGHSNSTASAFRFFSILEFNIIP